MKTQEEKIAELEKIAGIKLIISDGKVFIGGSLDLSYTGITSLPDNLTVGEWLDLSHTGITSLPDNLTVGEWLDLSHTGITSLPDSLIVGGWLDLRHTGITSLPDNLTVGGWLCLGGTDTMDTPIVNRHVIIDFTKKIWGDKPYIRVDGIFAKVISHHGNLWRVRKIASKKDLYIATDGQGNYAHGDTVDEAKEDLIYKTTNHDKSDYKGLAAESILSFEEAVKCYKVITGACSAGTRDFVDNCLKKSDKKKNYTIAEIAKLTKGRYGNQAFVEFFKLKI